MLSVPPPLNDQNKSYLVGSPERAEIKARLAQMAGERVDMPLVIGGQEIRTGRTERSVMPHDHRHVLGDWHVAEAAHVTRAIDAARAAARDWSRWPFADRAAVLLRAAELLTTTWRSTLNAATMLGQSKTVFQAEIDSASGDRLLALQSVARPGTLRRAADQQRVMWNQMKNCPAAPGVRCAVTPFNFTASGGNHRPRRR
jgi:1-pyrroline-5-carboxylate dehydrogenase